MQREALREFTNLIKVSSPFSKLTSFLIEAGMELDRPHKLQPFPEIWRLRGRKSTEHLGYGSRMALLAAKNPKHKSERGWHKTLVLPTPYLANFITNFTYGKRDLSSLHTPPNVSVSKHELDNLHNNKTDPNHKEKHQTRPELLNFLTSSEQGWTGGFIPPWTKLHLLDVTSTSSRFENLGTIFLLRRRFHQAFHLPQRERKNEAASDVPPMIKTLEPEPDKGGTKGQQQTTLAKPAGTDMSFIWAHWVGTRTYLVYRRHDPL